MLFKTVGLYYEVGVFDSPRSDPDQVYDFTLPNSLIKTSVVSPGHEGLFPGRSLPLHPLPDLSDRQSLF